MTKLLGLALALALSACVHTTRTQLGPIPALEPRQSCDRSQDSSCTPNPERVDTNMLAPRAENRPLAG